MITWTTEELAALDSAHEIRVAARRGDGSLRKLVTIWQVVVDGAVYVRSVRGVEGRWYQAVIRHSDGAIDWHGNTRDVTFTSDASHDTEIDAAYFAKYGNGAPTRSIVNLTAKQTTLRVDPK